MSSERTHGISGKASSGSAQVSPCIFNNIFNAHTCTCFIDFQIINSSDISSRNGSFGAGHFGPDPEHNYDNTNPSSGFCKRVGW